MQPKQQLQRTKNLLRNFGTLIFAKSLTDDKQIIGIDNPLDEEEKLSNMIAD